MRPARGVLRSGRRPLPFVVMAAKSSEKGCFFKQGEEKVYFFAGSVL
jgi:hypothetical protein